MKIKEKNGKAFRKKQENKNIQHINNAVKLISLQHSL